MWRGKRLTYLKSVNTIDSFWSVKTSTKLTVKSVNPSEKNDYAKNQPVAFIERKNKKF